MAVRDETDLYAELGVEPSATIGEIGAAFRARAKELHPDARPGDADAAERFKRVTTAYRVLSNTVERSIYDSDRRLRTPRPVPAAAATPVEAAPGRRTGLHLSRRGARWAVVGGIACLLTGIAATLWVISLQRHDAELRSKGRPAVATVVDVGGRRRYRFRTSDGRLVEAREPVKTGEGEPRVGEKVDIYYDRHDPRSVTTISDKTGRNVTLWIVAIKLLLGGPVLVVVGSLRLRRP